MVLLNVSCHAEMEDIRGWFVVVVCGRLRSTLVSWRSRLWVAVAVSAAAVAAAVTASACRRSNLSAGCMVAPNELCCDGLRKPLQSMHAICSDISHYLRLVPPSICLNIIRRPNCSPVWNNSPPLPNAYANSVDSSSDLPPASRKQ